MKTRSNKVLNVRPHPGPLPQEREKHSSALGVRWHMHNLCAPRFAQPKLGNRWDDFQTTRDVRWVFPLPGGEGQGEGERHN